MAQAHQILGRIEAEEGHHEAAASRYRDAIEREPGNAEHFELLGGAH